MKFKSFQYVQLEKVDGIDLVNQALFSLLEIP